MQGAFLTGAAVTLLVAWLSPGSAAHSADVSTPGSTSGWYLSSTRTGEDGLRTTTGGSGGWVEDEVGGQPGRGSVLLSVDAADQRAALETTQFNRYALGELQSFAYSTSQNGAPGHAPSLTVTVDPDGPAEVATLVWEPARAGLAVAGGAWQRWDSSAGDGWWTPGTDGPPGAQAGATDLATLVDRLGAGSEVLTIAVDVGRHGAMTAHVDGVSVTTTDGTAAFDFEPDRAQADAVARR